MKIRERDQNFEDDIYGGEWIKFMKIGLTIVAKVLLNCKIL